MHALGIMAVLRDEQLSLDPWLQAFEQLENSLAIPIVYSFLENNSSDATPAMLRAWMAGRSGSLICEQVGAPSRRTGRAAERTIALAAARNQALDCLLRYPLQVVAIVDGGLQINVHQIRRLLQQLQCRPHASMVAASAMQNVPDVFGSSPFSHYDSFALRDALGRPGITFAEIPVWDRIERERWRAGYPVAVKSAFGGMAVVRRDAVEATSARWDGASGCEHWAFCAALWRYGPVVVDPLVQPMVWHAQPPRWSQNYAWRVSQALAAAQQ